MPNTLQRAWLILLVCFGAVTAGTAQSTAGCCILEDSLARVVRMEAAYLARNVVHVQGGPWADSIELPPDLVQTFYEAICAVRNEHSVVTDSLFTTLRFAYYPYTSIDVVGVNVDRNEPWYQKLRDSTYPSGYAPLDRLMSEYELNVSRLFEFSSYGSSPSVYFRSERYLNTPALSRAFAVLDGVESASPSRAIGDGDRLEGAIFPDYVGLLFSIGSGDCPSGCIDRSFYEFRVYPGCRADFVGRNSSITSLAESKTFQPQVYPNPFRNSFTVGLGHERIATYTVYGASGKLIARGTVSGNEPITLPTDRTGIYLLRLSGQDLDYSTVVIRQ